MGEKTKGNQNPNKVPGPGAYSPVRVTDVSAAYSMGSKTRQGMQMAIQPETGEHTKMPSNFDKTPGPGAYQAKAVYKNEHTGPRFGTDSRKGLGNIKGNVPGPNAYNQD